ncbi:hypothetical protein [Pantoea agglomerans]
MGISTTIRAKQVNSIVPYGDGWNRHIEIDVDELEIADAVKADEIVPEYAVYDLLNAIGQADVIAWLEREGYSVTDSD